MAQCKERYQTPTRNKHTRKAPRCTLDDGHGGYHQFKPKVPGYGGEAA